ncbi:unnamed protein product, partial [Nesidiocoris tenuis]
MKLTGRHLLASPQFPAGMNRARDRCGRDEVRVAGVWRDSEPTASGVPSGRARPHSPPSTSSIFPYKVIKKTSCISTLFMDMSPLAMKQRIRPLFSLQQLVCPLSSKASRNRELFRE